MKLNTLTTTRSKNRRNLQIGFYCLNLVIVCFVFAALGHAETLIDDGYGGIFFFVFYFSMAGAFIFFFVLGLFPRYKRWLTSNDLISPSQRRWLDFIPDIIDDEQGQ